MPVDKNVNRAVILLIVGLIVTAWVLINASDFIMSAFVFIVMGIITMFLMWNWKKIKPFGK